MPDGSETITAKIITSIGSVDPGEWDACAGGDNPFISHAFLKALEDSGSTTARTGWLPHHIVLERPDGCLIAAAPMYLKSHSYGEYVFDHGWADAYERAGGRYYPKLQVAAPFSPVTGPRLLVREGAGADAARGLIGTMETLGRRNGLSSVHVTFASRSDWELLGDAGWLLRTGQQYHWTNDGYDTFDDFLGALNSRKRKAIRRERQEVARCDVRVHTLTGSDLKAAHWDAFYRFYKDTSNRKWGSAYLTRDFFHILGDVMPDKIVLIMAEADGDWIAGALNLRGTDTLFGRNWGAIREFPFLHFEACYYRAIDFAIEHRLSRVEAGAQGEHKIQRGYLPTLTYSAHWVRDPGFAAAVSNYLDRERVLVDEEIAQLMEESPFRRETGQ